MRILSLAGRRLAASIPTLFLILIGVFLLLQLAPGDTVDALMAQMGGGDAATAEALRDEGKQYDIVTAMEVVEHVLDPAEFLRCVADLVRPGGMVFMSTMSRTALSYFLTIFLAEDLLRVVSRGTHRHAQYINPEELVAFFRDELRWFQPEAAQPTGRATLPDGAPVAPLPLRLQYETRGTMYLPLLEKWVLARPSVADAAATAQPVTSWVPPLLGGTQRWTEQCNYFFYARKPM